MEPAMKTDHGWAWVVLAASVGSNFLNGCLVYFVGVVHAGLLRRYDESVTMTAWAGGLYSSLMSLGAPVASLIIGRFGCRICSIAGGILCFIGLSASAFATSVGQLFFTYGLVAGLGLGLGYAPSMVTVGYYFDKFRGLASGISLTGMAVGILAGNLIMQFLMDEYSVSGAFLLAGAMSLHYCLFGMFYRPTVYERVNISRDVRGETEDNRKLFGSVHSLAIRGIEIKVTKSVYTLTREGKELVDDDLEIPLLQGVTLDNEAACFSSREKMDVLASATTEPYIQTTGEFDKTDSTEDSCHIPEPTINNRKHCTTEKRLAEETSVPRTDDTEEGVVVGILAHQEVSRFAESAADKTLTSTTGARNRPACEDRYYEITTAISQLQSSTQVIPTASSSQDILWNNIQTTASRFNVQKAASSPNVHKILSPNVQKASSSSELKKTSSNSGTRNSASGSSVQKVSLILSAQKASSSPNVHNASSSPTVQKAASSSNVRGAISSSKVQIGFLSPNVQRVDSNSSVRKAGSSPNVQKAALSSTVQISASSSTLQQEESSKEGKLLNVWEAYRAVLSNTTFICYCGCVLAFSFTVSGVFIHLPEFAQSRGSTPGQAATLFVAVGGFSLLSRLATGFCTTDERIDPNTINMGLCGLCGLATALFPFYSDTYLGQLIYSSLFGLYTGGLNVLLVTLSVRFVGVRLLNTAFAVLCLGMGIGYIAGPPFAGCMMEVAFLLNLAAGISLGSQSKAIASEDAVLSRDLTGSFLVISVPESTVNASTELM